MTTSLMLLVAAVFNWVVALALFFAAPAFLDLFSAAPVPEQTLWVQQFAGLVFFFGVGYYQASRDFDANRNIIRLAVWAKFGVVLIGVLNVILGDISWHFLIPASADGIFAVLFLIALKSPVAKA